MRGVNGPSWASAIPDRSGALSLAGTGLIVIIARRWGPCLSSAYSQSSRAKQSWDDTPHGSAREILAWGTGTQSGCNTSGPASRGRLRGPRGQPAEGGFGRGPRLFYQRGGGVWLFERPAIWRAFGPLARRLVWVARGGPFARAPPVRVALGSLGRPTTQRGALEARAVGKSLAARGRAVGSIELAARRPLGGGKRIPRWGGGARGIRTTRVPPNWDDCARRDSLGRPDSGTRASWGLDGATAPFRSGGGLSACPSNQRWVSRGALCLRFAPLWTLG